MPAHPFTPRFAIMAVVAALACPAAGAQATNPNALWDIVHGKCVPNELRHHHPKPCAAVNLKHGVARGYAVLKDLYGATHFLLIPTARITGIESRRLLERRAPNYFAAAWRERLFVAKALARPLPDEDLGLAVNCRPARTQNQLHIHIDCIRADVQRALHAARKKIGNHWRMLDAPLVGHRYEAMRVLGNTLHGKNPFKLVADDLPGARADMRLRTIAVVGMVFAHRRPGFVILEHRADPARGDYAGGSLLLDRACALGHRGS